MKYHLANEEFRTRVLLNDSFVMCEGFFFVISIFFNIKTCEDDVRKFYSYALVFLCIQILFPICLY